MLRIPYRSLLIMVVLLMVGHSLASQEVLTGKLIRKRDQDKGVFLKRQVATDSLGLPFIDDFARGIGDPYAPHWVDQEAFVNRQYGINPPSIGVVTLDAVDESGKLPPNANTSGYASDELTSRAFKLEMTPSDSVYLSFYYQTGGRGDPSGAEYQDSLVLKFYNPQTKQWRSVWRVAHSHQDSIFEVHRPLSNQLDTVETGAAFNEKFYHAMVPVQKPGFLNDGFRMRFMNYASLSESEHVPTRRGNVDQWNIDFIRLDSARSLHDTIIDDVAFVENLPPMLNHYESVPWDHWPDASVYEMRDSLSITYRNLGNRVWNVFREFDIIDRMGDNETFSFTGGTGDALTPYTTETYSRPITYVFPYDSDQDSALFELRSYLITDTLSERAPYRWNDTISHFQQFYDYYAYDDGTAENGYGFTGSSSHNVMVALHYETYTPDTLQAIQMYFNQTLDSVSQKPFNLKVWTDKGGRPGKLLYEQSGVRPVYEDSLNKFHQYVLREKIYLEGSFFVGYEKIDKGMLNVGFDRNRVHNDQLFYNYAGEWIQSQIKGALMIRPVFGDYIPPIATANAPAPDRSDHLEVTLYPNPVQGRLHVRLDGSPHPHYTYSLFDMQGRAVVQGKQLKPTLRLDRLSPGMYLMRLRNRTNNAVVTKKIMITR